MVTVARETVDEGGSQEEAIRYYGFRSETEEQGSGRQEVDGVIEDSSQQRVRSVMNVMALHGGNPRESPPAETGQRTPFADAKRA